jgi:ATP adenylyltransferase/5',5'''-P-1,P-4-tetraphosphate phosphorylase II
MERVALDAVDPAVEAQRARNVFQTREWLEFVARSQGAEPVVARVERDASPLGRSRG